MGRACPQCGDNVPDLLKLDAGLRQRLRETGEFGEPAQEVCPNCYRTLTAAISQGAQLRAKQLAKDQQRMIMWRNRVQMLKSGKAKMQEKFLSEAGLYYEKYLRTLEIVFDVQPGELRPEHFKGKSREQELTVVASVYWDLLKIYDSSPRYAERQQKTIEKLTEFAKASGMSARIAKQAQLYISQAKSPELFKKVSGSTGGVRKCFIATAAFDSADASEVVILSSWRDEHLVRHAFGRAFIDVYYAISPAIADFIQKHPGLKAPVRLTLTRIARLLSRRFNWTKTS